MSRQALIALGLTALALAPGCVIPSAVAEPVSYRKDVLPVLIEHCRRCHKTGTPGSTAVVLFDAWDNPRDAAIKASMPALIGAIRSGRMPLGQPGIVPEGQIKVLEAWQAEGSPDN